MNKLNILAALLLIASLSGCQGNPPATRNLAPVADDGAVKPFAVEVNDNIAHAFYRDVSLEALLKELPSGSVDSLEMNLGGPAQVFALVRVPERAEMDLSKVRFETTFRTKDGQMLEKRWTAAKDRKTGKATALFSLPPTVDGGATKIVPNDR